MFQRPFDEVEHKSRKEDYHHRGTKPLAVDINLICVENVHEFRTSEILQIFLFHVWDSLFLQGFFWIKGRLADLSALGAVVARVGFGRP